METVAEQHKKHLAVMRGWLGGKGFFQTAEALEWVRNFELGTRKDACTPKFDHQLSVARLTMTLAPHLMFPEETLTVAFLHDMVEDHGDQFSRQEMERKFGTRVAEAVMTISKKGHGFTKTYEHYFAEMAACPCASVIKCADRVHNLDTMTGVFTLEKQKAYREEVEKYFFPMIKQARRNFPRQFGAYENLKILLHCQCELLQEIHRITETVPQNLG